MSKLANYVSPVLGVCLVWGLAACGQASSVPSTMPAGGFGAKLGLEEPGDAEPEHAASLPSMDGSLLNYLDLAVKRSPRVRAAFEKWRSARYGVGKSGRLPEPTISVGYYLRSVETRVGPQIYNLNISQTIPWLGKLAADEDAASERARAEALVTDAEVLAVRRDLAEAYWTLWLISEEHRLRMEHDVLLEALAGAVRGRVQTGSATLADLNQIDLNIARHHDHRGAHEQAARRASARLLALLGAGPKSEILLASDAPLAGLPKLADQELVERARRHPLIGRLGHLARSETHVAHAQAADRYPRFTLGANLIGTGEAPMPGVTESGKDALIVSAGLSLPIWRSSYSDAEAAARAQAASHRAMAEHNMRQAEASVTEVLAELRDTQRRMELYEGTLLPQAQSTVEAVLGGYQVKSSSVAAVILAQRDLIELLVEHAKARAQHAKAWSQLEFLVGATLAGGDTSHD